MTVAELIAALQNFRPDLRVLVDGYARGYDEPSLLSRKVADNGWIEPTVLGKFDDAYPSDIPGAFEVLIISRYDP